MKAFLALALGLSLSGLTFAQVQPKSESLGTFEIVKYERKEAFAGKLGKLITETFTLKKSGKTYTLKVPPYHTLPSGQTKPFCSTCPVEIVRGSISKSDIKAERKNIVQDERTHKGKKQ